MNKNEIIRKLTSRKLWVAIVGIVVGLAAAFGLDENQIGQVAGVVTSAVSILGYVFGESFVDAKREAAKIPVTVNLNELPEEDNGEGV